MFLPSVEKSYRTPCLNVKLKDVSPCESEPIIEALSTDQKTWKEKHCLLLSEGVKLLKSLQEAGETRGIQTPKL